MSKQNYVCLILSFSALRHVHQFISDSKADIVFVELDDKNVEIDNFIECGLRMKNICEADECWRYINKAIIDLTPKKTFKFLQASLMLGLINSKNWFYLLSLDNTEHGMDAFSHNMMRFSVAGQFDEHILNNNGTYIPLIDKYKLKLKREKLNKTDLVGPLNVFIHF